MGLIVEQHFLSLFTYVLDESPKYLKSREEINSAAELNSKHGKYQDPFTKLGGSAKWLGKLHKTIRSEESNSTVLEIQELVEKSKIVHMEWKNERVFIICLADGKIINVGIRNLFTSECLYSVDRFYPFNDPVSDMAFNDQLVMYLMTDGRLHVNWKETPSPESDFIEPDFINMTYQNLLPNKMSKRCEKKLTLDKNSNLFAIWWSRPRDDILPWVPTAEQRANIFIFTLKTKEPVLLWYLKTDNNILQIKLLSEVKKVVVLDESSDSEGHILITEVIHSIENVSKECQTVIPLQSELKAHAYDNTISKLAMTCCDSSVLIYCRGNKCPRSTKAAFIPSAVSWHPDSYLIFVAGDNGQYQLFDIVLNPILVSESSNNTPSILNELVPCSSIEKSCWMSPNSKSGDSCLLLRFESGPITILRLGIQCLKLVDLVKFYLCEESISESINVLKNNPWIFEDSLRSMLAIFNQLIKQRHADDIEFHLENLLAVYFVPREPNDDDSARKLDLKPMRTLARRFFMWLVTGRKYHRAMQIATSLNDVGLFHKLHQVAQKCGKADIVFEVLQKLSEYSQEYSSETDSESESGCWSSHSESYPSCLSSEIEQDVQVGRYLSNTNSVPELDESSRTIIHYQETQTRAQSEDSERSASTIPSPNDSKISIINFGQV